MYIRYLKKQQKCQKMTARSNKNARHFSYIILLIFVGCFIQYMFYNFQQATITFG